MDCLAEVVSDVLENLHAFRAEKNLVGKALLGTWLDRTFLADKTTAQDPVAVQGEFHKTSGFIQRN